MFAPLIAIYQHPHLPTRVVEDMLKFYESIYPRQYPWGRPISIDEIKEWLRELDVYSDFSLALCYRGTKLVGLAWLQPSKVRLEIDDEDPHWDLCVDKLLARAWWFSREFGYSGKVLISVGLEYKPLKVYVEHLVNGFAQISSICMGLNDSSKLCSEREHPLGYRVIEAKSIDEASKVLRLGRRELIEAIARVYNRAFSTYEWFTASSSVEDYEEWIIATHPLIIVAYDDHKGVLGYLLYMSYVASDGVETIYLHEVAVDPSVQRRGIGTTLVKRLACIAKGKRIVLDALAEVEGFYSKMGFEVYAKRARVIANLGNLPSEIESITA